MIWGVIGSAAIVLGLLVRRWLSSARRDRTSAADSAIKVDGSGRFHALSIRFGSGACEVARRLHGKRFLLPDAPALPLAGCVARNCRCRFVHHRDRRDGDDRRSPFQKGYGGSATRMAHDRRGAADRRSGGGDTQYQ